MKVSDGPMVSVITPVYNGEAFLADCVESILNQTYWNFEYIIVNNSSTDRTLDIALNYAESDRRIQVHTNAAFVGVIENHNIAFRLMSKEAKYCKVVSADDFIFSTCLEHMVELAEANPSVGIVGSYQLSGSYVKWQGFDYPRVVFSGREICRRVFLGEQVFIYDKAIIGFGSPTSLMYRADLVRGVAEWYPGSSPHADTSACFRALCGADFGFVHQVLSYERVHENTESSRAAKVNRSLPSLLEDLLEYGISYLSTDELGECIKQTLSRYYRFLAINYFIGGRGREFWAFHKGTLERLGFRVGYAVLLRAAITAMLRECLNPELAIRRLRRRFLASGDNKVHAKAALGCAAITPKCQ